MGMSPAPTVNVKSLKAALGAARVAGLDVGELLRRWEMTPASLEDPDLRFPRDVWVELWQEVENVSGDPCIGLHAAERLPPDHFDLVDYLAASSHNLRTGLERFARYFAIVATGVVHKFREVGDLVYLERHCALDAISRIPHPAEFAIACVVLRSRPHTEIDWQPHAVSFAHRAPPHLGEHRRVFRCPVRFEAEVTAIVFNRQTLDIPMKSPQPELCRILESHGQELMARLPRQGSLVDLVRRALLEELRGGHPELSKVARKLGVSNRTLQRRLREVGTSLQDLLDEVRRDLALRYLKDASLAVAEVSYLLGFSEVSNFYRAFRRWTDSTPLEYRRDNPATNNVA